MALYLIILAHEIINDVQAEHHLNGTVGRTTALRLIILAH